MEKTKTDKDVLEELKSFLELTNHYTERLLCGEEINSIFRRMAKEKNLKFISKKQGYHYTDEVRKKLKQSLMLPIDREDVDKEIYAMVYAYGRLYENPQTEIEIINAKLKEMKRR